ncbi:MAG: hypothetical protein HOP03_09850 [Lysobacter sp.]|nr:hypothetical protein [Lysobacter sp.]
MHPRSVVFSLAYGTILLATPAFALTTQAPGHVSDAEVLRLLREVYREKATLQGDWPAAAIANDSEEIAPTSRKVCADSGAGSTGPRRVAVCTSFADGGHAQSGEVDLFLMLDPRGAQTQARIGASERGIESGGWGTPGEVRFFEIGPGRAAFVLTSGYANMGWATENVSLHHAESDRFVKMLTVSTHLSNTGACDPAEDRTCRKQSISLDCTLRTDKHRYHHGFYDLVVKVTGERGGKKVARSIPIPFANGVYRAPAEALRRDGCDEGF